MRFCRHQRNTAARQCCQCLQTFGPLDVPFGLSTAFSRLHPQLTENHKVILLAQCSELVNDILIKVFHDVYVRLVGHDVQLLNLCCTSLTDFHHAKVRSGGFDDAQKLVGLCHIDREGEIRLLALDQLQEVLRQSMFV